MHTLKHSWGTTFLTKEIKGVCVTKSNAEHGLMSEDPDVLSRCTRLSDGFACSAIGLQVL